MAVHGAALIADGDFADCYSAGMGRPSIPPSLLAGGQRIWTGSERWGWRPMRCRATHTTLSLFRSQLLVNDADQRVLRVTLERAVLVGVVPRGNAGDRQLDRGDGPAAVAETYELIHQAIATLIGAAGGGGAAQRGFVARPTGSSTARPASTAPLPRPAGPSWAASFKSPKTCWLPPPATTNCPTPGASSTRMLSRHQPMAVVQASAREWLVSAAKHAGAPVREVLGNTAYGDERVGVAAHALAGRRGARPGR